MNGRTSERLARLSAAYASGYDRVVERGPLAPEVMRSLWALNDRNQFQAWSDGEEEWEARYAGRRDAYEWLLVQVECYEEEAP